MTCKSCKERRQAISECKYITHRDNRLIYKCKECNTNLYKSMDTLKDKFPCTYELANGDNDKFMLLLRKGIYPYEYMDSWEKFDEDKPTSREDHYSNLNLENIMEEDCKHVDKVWDTFKIKNSGEYHDLYVQSDTLLLTDIFENFRSTFLEIYQLDPAYFVSLPGLAWQACLKKTRVKLELLTDPDMLLMFEAGIRGGIS